MKCEYADCRTENHKNHIVKYGFYDGSQRYKCLNCNRYFIKQEELKVPKVLKVRKRKSLTDDEKHIIDRLVDENISYRAIARVLNRALSTIQNYVYSKKNKMKS